MRKAGLLLGVVMAASLLGYGKSDGSKSDGSWLKKVGESDRQRTNPFAGNAEAVAAGRNLFLNNCAKCHGQNATGKGSRPSLRSERLQHATDGEIAWILRNGNPYKGMPSWGGLPEQERWQIVAYLRSLNATSAEPRP